MNENKKTENTIHEVKDEELDAVTGGRGGRPGQQQTKKCATDGCNNQISADSPTDFCKDCLRKMHNQKRNPFT